MLQETAKNVVDWLANIGVQLAVEKMELILLTRTRTYNILDVTVKGRRITSSLCVKYLCVYIDRKATFGVHAASVTKKAHKPSDPFGQSCPTSEVQTTCEEASRDGPARNVVLRRPNMISQNVSCSIESVKKVPETYCTESGL